MLIPEAPKVADMNDNLIPEATYNIRCVKADYVAIPKTADAKGAYVAARFVITGPDVAEKMKGRMLFQNFTVVGDTFRLKEFLKMTGHGDDFVLSDTDALLGLECGAAVQTQKGTGGYSDKSVIGKFIPMV